MSVSPRTEPHHAASTPAVETKRSGSHVAVYAAIIANVAVVITKGFVAWYTGSAAMLSEALHSLGDTGNEALLLIGLWRGGVPADSSHPFGYGLELYFWSFIVALLIFASGGSASVFYGIMHLRTPTPIEHAWASYIVIGAAALFEGTSFFIALRQFRARAPQLSLFTLLHRSKDPSLFIVVMEDGAALMGLAIAALGVAGSQFGVAWADGVAAILIGVMLVAVAIFLANETRSLLAGEAAPAPIVDAVEEVVAREGSSVALSKVQSLQLGPSQILIAVSLRPNTELRPAEFHALFARLRRNIRRIDPRIAHVFFGTADE